VAAVDHDHVEAGMFGPERGRREVVDHGVDHVEAHLLDLLLGPTLVFYELPGHRRGTYGFPAPYERRSRLTAAVVELDGSHRSVVLDGLDHLGERADEAVVTQVELQRLGDGPVLVDRRLHDGDQADASPGLRPVELHDTLVDRLVGVGVLRERRSRLYPVLDGQAAYLDRLTENIQGSHDRPSDPRTMKKPLALAKE